MKYTYAVTASPGNNTVKRSEPYETEKAAHDAGTDWIKHNLPHEGTVWYLDVEREKAPLSDVGRSYKVIRREKGKPDVPIFLPYTASESDAVHWCESEGYKVIDHEIIKTPFDEKHIETIVLTVEPKD